MPLMSRVGMPPSFMRRSRSCRTVELPTPTLKSTCATPPAEYLPRDTPTMLDFCRLWLQHLLSRLIRRSDAPGRLHHRMLHLEPRERAPRVVRRAPVLELGDLDVGDGVQGGLDEAQEGARLLGDGGRQHRLPQGADVGQLADQAQAVEVDVGAAGNRHHRGALRRARADAVRRSDDTGAASIAGSGGHADAAAGCLDRVASRGLYMRGLWTVWTRRELSSQRGLHRYMPCAVHLHVVALEVRLGAGHCDGSRRLQAAPRLVEHVLDGRADRAAGRTMSSVKWVLDAGRSSASVTGRAKLAIHGKQVTVSTLL